MTVTTPHKIPDAEPKCPKCGDLVQSFPPTGWVSCTNRECDFSFPYCGLTFTEESAPNLAEKLQKAFVVDGIDICPACGGRYVFVHPESGTYVCGDPRGYSFQNTIVQWTKSTPRLDPAPSLSERLEAIVSEAKAAILDDMSQDEITQLWQLSVRLSNILPMERPTETPARRAGDLR